jgi:hypothetical protein
VRKAFLHAITGQDNETTDLGRVLLAFFSVSLVVLQTVATIRGHTFEPVSFATAAGGLLVAGCGAIRIKASTEPDPKP